MPQSRKDAERQRHIDQTLAVLEKALSRCREEDVRYTTVAIAALSYLERVADGNGQFNNFGKEWRIPGWMEQSRKPAGKR